MHRCTSCNKKFDYEKNYGLCPKCGAYNQKPINDVNNDYKISLNEEREFKSHKVFSHNHDQIDKKKSQQHAKRNFGSDKKPRLGLTIVLIVLIVLCFITVGVADKAVTFVQNEILKDVKTDTDNEVTDIIEVAPGKTFTANGVYDFTVESAITLCDANVEADFPEGEKCIAVNINAVLTDEGSAFRFLEIPYIEANGVFKSAISPEDISTYPCTAGLTLLDRYSAYSHQIENGYLIYFVDSSVTEISIYFEDYEEAGDDIVITQIYKVTLPLDSI